MRVAIKWNKAIKLTYYLHKENHFPIIIRIMFDSDSEVLRLPWQVLNISNKRKGHHIC